MSTAIISGLFALVGALGGVWLSQAYTVRLARERISEARRDAHRRVISELLAAGWAKVELCQPILPSFSTFTQWSDVAEFMETDTGRELSRNDTELQRTLVQAALFSADPQLLAAIAKVRAREHEFSNDVVGPALRNDLPRARRNLSRFGDALMEVEVAAVELLRVSTAASRPMWRLPWGRDKPDDPG